MKKNYNQIYLGISFLIGAILLITLGVFAFDNINTQIAGYIFVTISPFLLLCSILCFIKHHTLLKNYKKQANIEFARQKYGNELDNLDLFTGKSSNGIKFKKKCSRQNRSKLYYLLCLSALIISMTFSAIATSIKQGDIFYLFTFIFFVAFIVFLIKGICASIKNPERNNSIFANIAIPMNKKQAIHNADYFLINSATKQWQVYQNNKLLKFYFFDDIANFSFMQDNSVIYSKLPEPLSLMAMETKNSSKEDSCFIISTNDPTSPGFVINCTKEALYQLMKTFELLKIINNEEPKQTNYEI